MSSLFFSLQGSYKQLHIVLLNGDILLDSILEESSRASAMLVPHLDSMLKKNGYTLSDLAFIAVDQGPGAFTSLRVMISTVNALGFAAKIPLIGVDGLDALALQTKNQTSIPVSKIYYCILLNAFNQEVFFGIYDAHLLPVMDKGYKNIDELLTLIGALEADATFVFAGNGAKLFAEKIQLVFALRALFAPIEVASAQTIGLSALTQWENKNKCTDTQGHCYKLVPLYMKLQAYAIKT